MAYWSEVRYIAESEPNMIGVNAEEYARLSRLINAAMPEVQRVRANTEWEGAGRDGYDRKLGEVAELLWYLGDAFTQAGKALADYVPEIKRAKALVADGEEMQDELSGLLAEFQSTGTNTFRAAEPLRQWEDLRQVTGFLDRLSDPLTIDGALRARADQLHGAIHSDFAAALRIERAAREACVPRLRLASQLLPDYLASSEVTDRIIASTPGLAAEVAGAVDAPHVRLTGVGEMPLYPDATRIAGVSPALQDLRDQAAALPGGHISWDTTDSLRWKLGIGDTVEAFKLSWIADNKVVIQAAAERYGLPPDVLAGVAYREVGDKPLVLDDLTDWTRQHVPEPLTPDVYGLPGDPDSTSYGPMAVQVRRAAEALGYDPVALTDEQREEIVKSLQDPKENIFIAAQHLSDLKKASDFALVAPGDMTPEHGRELAARFNGGPDWQSHQAQDYARRYMEDHAKAAAALR